MLGHGFQELRYYLQIWAGCTEAVEVDGAPELCYGPLT